MKTSWLLKACVVPTWRLKCEARTAFTWLNLKQKNLCGREFCSWKWTSPNNICTVAGELNFGVLIISLSHANFIGRAEKLSSGSMKHSLQSVKLLWGHALQNRCRWISFQFVLLYSLNCNWLAYNELFRMI